MADGLSLELKRGLSMGAGHPTCTCFSRGMDSSRPSKPKPRNEGEIGTGSRFSLARETQTHTLLKPACGKTVLTFAYENVRATSKLSGLCATGLQPRWGLAQPWLQRAPRDRLEAVVFKLGYTQNHRLILKVKTTGHTAN